MTFALGIVAKDKITGFKGVIVGRTEWLDGCVRYAIQSMGVTKEGKIVDELWFDEQRIDELKTRSPVLNYSPLKHVKKLTKKARGGPQQDPVR